MHIRHLKGSAHMRGSRIFWAGAVLSAVGAASAVLLLVGHARHMERVVVARHGIQPWSLITPGDLTLAQRPVVGLLPGTILSMGQVQGRFAVTGGRIPQMWRQATLRSGARSRARGRASHGRSAQKACQHRLGDRAVVRRVSTARAPARGAPRICGAGRWQNTPDMVLIGTRNW